jgi:ribonuclease BN (tRNA processing enzyme)
VSDRLIFLGTKGGPSLRGEARLPSANALVVDGVPFVLDTGYGASLRLVQAGVALPSIRHLLLTHLHSDHCIDAGPLLYNAWANGLASTVDLYGPAGVGPLIAAYWESMRYDIEVRIADEGRPDLRRLVRVHTYAEGTVLDAVGVADTAAVAVTALRNLHPPVAESYALRFAFKGKAVVFSGDTAYFAPLADFARGADILVHEAMYGPAIAALARRNPNAARMLEHLSASHTLVEDAGKIAALAEAKTLVLNHLVPSDDPALTDADWIAAARTHYAGEIVVAKDLMEMAID